MPSEVTNIKLKEISLVDKGANPGAHVLLVKRKKPDTGETSMADNNDLKKSEDMEGVAPEMSLTEAMDVIKQLRSELEVARSMVAEKAEKPSDEYIMVDGEKVEKASVPAVVLKQLEQKDEEIAKRDAEIAKAKAESEKADLEKRASDAFPGLSGSNELKAELLKSVEGSEKADDLLTMLKGSSQRLEDDENLKKASKTDETGASSPASSLNKRAEEYAKEHGVTKSVALLKVSRSPEGRELIQNHVKG